jgi:pilus assembly protein Flp/PilA
MLTLLAQFTADESGATSIEYGIIAGGIAVAIAAVVAQVGGQLNTSFEAVKPILVPK